MGWWPGGLPGRPCVTSMHRDLLPAAPKGTDHMGTLVYLKLRIWQDLAQQKGFNVRNANGIYIQGEESTSWNNGPGRERVPAHLYHRELVSMAFVFSAFLKGLPPWLLPPKAKQQHSSQAVTHHHLTVGCSQLSWRDECRVALHWWQGVEMICKLGAEACCFW